MGGFEKLKGMSMESLAEVTARYPWFGVAQKLLCVRLSRLGGDELGTARYAEAAMHVACRRKVLSLLRKDIAAEPHVSGEEVFPSAVASVSAGEDVLYGKPSDGQVPEPEIRHEETGFRGVGDYFSQAQYARVRQKEDDSLRRFVSSDADVPVPEIESGFDMDFCTETLARIYAEQGYCQQAKEIYSKLILAYPEKNAYFAALIEKLGSEN